VKLHQSSALDAHIRSRKQKDPRLGKPIKDAAAHTFKVTDIGQVALGMELLAPVVEGPEMTAVVLSDVDLALYAGTPDEVRALVDRIRLPAKKAAPRKVAVKMVSLRVTKLLKEYGEIARKHGEAACIPPRPDIHARPFLRAMEEYRTGWAKGPAWSYAHGGLLPVLDDLILTLKRDEVGDEVVEEAVNLVCVGDVMGS